MAPLQGTGGALIIYWAAGGEAGRNLVACLRRERMYVETIWEPDRRSVGRVALQKGTHMTYVVVMVVFGILTTSTTTN